MPTELAGAPPIDLLTGMSFVRGLSPQNLGRLAGAFRVLRFEDAETIFRKGDTSLDLYVIIRGMAAIHDPGLVPGAGHDVAVLGPGDVFGEIAFIDSAERTMDAVCRLPTELAVLGQEDYFGLIAEHPAIGAVIYCNLAMELCRRLRQANEENKSLRQSSAR
jgi:CRP-like cAMP-binding protein